MLWKKRYNFDKANEVVKQVQKMAQEKLDTFSKKCVTKQENKETATKSGTESEEKVDVTQELPNKDAAMGKKSDLSLFQCDKFKFELYMYVQWNLFNSTCVYYIYLDWKLWHL